MPNESLSPSDETVWPVHVEVRLTQRTSTPFSSIRKHVHQYITENYETIFMPSVLTGWESNGPLRNSVERIAVSESSSNHSCLLMDKCLLQIHVYQPTDNSTYEKMTANPSDTSEEYTAGTISELPSRELEGLWESLFYESDVKTGLLDYIYATVCFSDAKVDYNLVSWNRVVLLHGPPGTGKTSLCRALAQKLSIRLKDRYNKTHLFEINSHSLFSRWFSESGKLVQNLFSTVAEMTREEEDFIVLLIDEVESLTAARAGAISGSEPSDALRAVNALLTQIDRLKHQKNVLIMATSNLAKAIDSAFVDRADIAQYIDYPPAEAIYEILRSSLLELMKKGFVERIDVPLSKTAVLSYRVNGHSKMLRQNDNVTENSLYRPSLSSFADKGEIERFVGSSLYGIAEKCKGTSGRSLRRLPVLAHARYVGHIPTRKNINKPNGNSIESDGKTIERNEAPGVPIDIWLKAMQKVVDDESGSRGRFEI